MPIKLHPSCRDQIIRFLAEALPAVQIQHNMFLDRLSLAALSGIDKKLDAKVLAEAQGYVDEHPLYEFVTDWLSRELEEQDSYVGGDDASSALTTNNAFSDLPAVSTRIVEEFCSLPRQYTFTMEIPPNAVEAIVPLVASLPLSDTTRLARPDDDFRSTYPLATGSESKDRRLLGLGLLSIAADRSWNHDTCVFQMQRKGYTSRYAQSNTSEEAIASIKTFFGLGLALRVFTPTWRYQPYPQRIRMYIHRFEGGKWALHGSSELSSDVSEVIMNLKAESMDGKLDESQKKGLALYGMNKLRAIYSAHGDISRIFLAAQWLFDSYTGYNQLLSFVQATVAMEILLGDKQTSDLIGLNELLRNRCAYLIGKSQAQRDELMKDFSKIYDVRSQIVHRGKARLSYSERELLSQLRWICGRVIQEEIDLIAANKPKEGTGA
jgi:hypothetical protein